MSDVAPRPPASRIAFPPEGGARPSSPRYPLLDLLRVLAMGDIVSIHVTGRYLFAGLGLPVFIIAALTLAFRKPTLPKLGESARLRTRRVLWPWLVWSAAYGIGYVLLAVKSPDTSLRDLFDPWMVVAGTSVHLWFLPFIFVAELAALAALRCLHRVPSPAVVATSLLLGVVAIGRDGEHLRQHRSRHNGLGGVGGSG